MKTVITAKKPFSKGNYSPVKHARYLDWEDAFEVEFDDGLSFLEAHRTIKKATRFLRRRCPSASAAQEIPLTFQNRLRTGEGRSVLVICS